MSRLRRSSWDVTALCFGASFNSLERSFYSRSFDKPHQPRLVKTNSFPENLFLLDKASRDMILFYSFFFLHSLIYVTSSNPVNSWIAFWDWWVSPSVRTVLRRNKRYLFMSGSHPSWNALLKANSSEKSESEWASTKIIIECNSHDDVHDSFV